MKRRATSRDVADRAGVSRSAVSLVLNGRGAGNISAANQAAILAAAAELDYRPNPVALSLRTRRSSTLGVVTDAIATSAYAGQLLRGAAERAAAHGHVLLVIDTHDDAAVEAGAFESLLARQVDGVVYAAMSLKPYVLGVALGGTPVSLANCFDPAGGLAGFVPDEIAGARAAARYLLDHGHRDVVMLTGDPPATASELREQGFAQAMTEAGLPVRPPVRAGWEIDKGYAAALHVLTAVRPRPTGLVVINDRAALGVVLAATALGLSVPTDLSVVGYDNDENVAPGCVPALTTVQLPHRVMGELAVQHLLDRLSADAAEGGDDRPAGTTLVDCPLVVRRSVAPPVRR